MSFQLVAVIQGGCQQVGLGAEVMQQAGLAEARPVRDLCDRGTAVAAGGEEVERDHQQTLPGQVPGRAGAVGHRVPVLGREGHGRVPEALAEQATQGDQGLQATSSAGARLDAADETIIEILRDGFYQDSR